MKKIKSILVIISIILLSGCSLPFQSTNYPAWKTKNLITNKDSNSGFMGLYVGDTAHTTDFDITIESYKEEDNKLSITLKIKNTTNNKKALTNRNQIKTEIITNTIKKMAIILDKFIVILSLDFTPHLTLIH